MTFQPKTGIFSSQNIGVHSAQSLRTTQEIKGEIQQHLGFFPPFFLPAMGSPELLDNLWQLTLSAYLANPLPALFKEKLLACLSRYCKLPYGIVGHSCALRSLGITGAEILQLLIEPVPVSETGIEPQLGALASTKTPLTHGLHADPALENNLLRISTLLFLNQDPTGHCQTQVCRALGPVCYCHLIELFAYAKVCYLWVEAHSEISYQDDPRVQENLGPLLREEPRLADFFRAHSEQVETEYRLREDVAERQQKEVEIRSLLNISNKLNSTLDIDELMDSLILEAMKLTDAELGWSGLRTKKGVVCHKYVRNSQFIPFEYCWPPGVGWPGWVLLHGVPYLTNDAASDNVIVPEIREQFGVKSGIDTPLLNIHSEVIGFFEVNNKKRGPFTESDVEKLTAVAQAASVALQNALVYRQLQDAQQALSESEDRYRRLVQLSPEPVGVHCDGKIAFINPAGAKLFGAAHPDELIGKPIMDLVHPDYRNIIQERLKGLAAGKPGPLLEQKGVTLDGRVIDVEAVATPITYQGKSAVQFLCRDITERKRTERSLRESDERFRSFMNYMTGYAWIKNVAGSYVYMNERLLKILPKHQDDWLGRTDSDFWPPEVAAEYKRNDQRVLRDKRDLQVIETWPREGQTRYGLVSKFPIFDAHGDAIMVGGTSIDITETKQIEEKLKTSRAQLRALAARLQSVREEEKMVLAREIHDELGQVLTALKMDLAYANRKLGGEGASIQEIHKKMHSMIQVIDDTVEKVRRIATDLRPDVLDNLGLVPALEWYAEEFQSRTGITCKTKLSTKRIVLDQTRATAIFRIFQETLTNVARHSGASLVEVNLRLLRDRLLLEIQDNGKGINGTDTRERNSLGILGMQERSLLLGGTFKITGIPGEGTTVSVMIPLSGKYR